MHFYYKKIFSITKIGLLNASLGDPMCRFLHRRQESNRIVEFPQTISLLQNVLWKKLSVNYFDRYDTKRENNPMCKQVLNIYKIWCRLPQYCNIHFDIYSGMPSAVHHRLFFFFFLIAISLCQESKIFQMCP